MGLLEKLHRGNAFKALSLSLLGQSEYSWIFSFGRVGHSVWERRQPVGVLWSEIRNRNRKKKKGIEIETENTDQSISIRIGGNGWPNWDWKSYIYKGLWQSLSEGEEQWKVIEIVQKFGGRLVDICQRWITDQRKAQIWIRIALLLAFETFYSYS